MGAETTGLLCMTFNNRFVYRPHMTIGLLIALITLSSVVVPATADASANDRYRIELIVFRNLDALAQPDQVQQIRRFFDAVDLQEAAIAPAPVLLEKTDGSFANIWTRLERLADYEPLVRLTFEQTMYDYHPRVRVHNDEVMGRELHFPADIVYLELADYALTDLQSPNTPGVDLFAGFVQPLFQLDGTLRMRRSRFLHLDLDLEYRLPGPAWEREFPVQAEDLLEPGFEWLGDAPQTMETGTAAPADSLATGIDASLEAPIPEPFSLHRLQQSRQIRSNTLQYFDSAFLGAIIRVTPIADEGP